LPPVDIDVKAKYGIIEDVVIPVREISLVAPAKAR
jgi:hypothetical protein